MAVLGGHRALIAASIAALGGVAACYSPELTDCTVTCSSADDCAGDQLCNGGLCAASGVDCGEVPPDPALPDAGPDPVIRVSLRVEVDHVGKVVVVGIGTCVNDEGEVETCQFNVPQGATLTLDAQMLVDKPFEKWEMSCEGQDASCRLRMSTALTARAKFK